MHWRNTFRDSRNKLGLQRRGDPLPATPLDPPSRSSRCRIESLGEPGHLYDVGYFDLARHVGNLRVHVPPFDANVGVCFHGHGAVRHTLMAFLHRAGRVSYGDSPGRRLRAPKRIVEYGIPTLHLISAEPPRLTPHKILSLPRGGNTGRDTIALRS